MIKVKMNLNGTNNKKKTQKSNKIKFLRNTYVKQLVTTLLPTKNLETERKSSKQIKNYHVNTMLRTHVV